MKRGIFAILLLIVILAALLSACFTREKDEPAAAMTKDAETAALQAGAEGLTEYLFAAAAPEETDYSNPYASETETRIGGDLYAIYEANKGCDADWEISLSEMKGTDKLAQEIKSDMLKYAAGNNK